MPVQPASFRARGRRSCPSLAAVSDYGKLHDRLGAAAAGGLVQGQDSAGHRQLDLGHQIRVVTAMALSCSNRAKCPWAPHPDCCPSSLATRDTAKFGAAHLGVGHGLDIVG